MTIIKIITFINIMLLGCNILFSQGSKVNELPYQLIDIDCSVRNKGTYIIKTFEEFKKLCKNNPSSEINFEQETLIGVIETTGGCQKPTASIEIVQNTEAKTIECSIKIDHFGPCRNIFLVKRWFVFQKPSDEYTIKIKIFKIYNN